LWLSAVLALALVAGGVQAEEKKENPEKQAEAKAKPSPTPDDGPEIDIPVPQGEKIKGIKIPHYGPDGKLIMMFDAETAMKTDETHIAMEVLKIDAYSEDGQKIYIELPTAVFNLETRIMAGDNNVLVRRDDFEITGKQGEFNTKTRFAKIVGNVKMVIKDIGDTPEAQPAASPTPSPSPAQP
jgi:hypothetical protein